MPEKFDSIGNQALKSFRHYIDPARHIWLKVSPQMEVEKTQSDHRICLVTETDDNDGLSVHMDTQGQLNVKSVDCVSSDALSNAVDEPQSQEPD